MALAGEEMIITKGHNFIPVKPKYMRWKKWYKEHPQLTPEDIDRVIDPTITELPQGKRREK